MTTQSERMQSNPSLHPVLRVKSSIWVAALAVMITLILVVTFAWANPSKGERLTSTHTALETISRRYQAMADRYAVGQNIGSLQALGILSDRYQGMATLHDTKLKADMLNALANISNRYQAQADRYQDK